MPEPRRDPRFSNEQLDEMQMLLGKQFPDLVLMEPSEIDWRNVKLASFRVPLWKRPLLALWRLLAAALPAKKASVRRTTEGGN